MGNTVRLSCLQQETAELIDAELRSAYEKHGPRPFASTHEGYGVLLEEVDELWEEVKHGFKKHNRNDIMWRKAMREEAIQIAAMAARFIQELT